MLKKLVLLFFLAATPVAANEVTDMCYNVGEMAVAFNDSKEAGMPKSMAKTLAASSLEGSPYEITDFVYFVIDVVYDTDLPFWQIKDILVTKCIESFS